MGILYASLEDAKRALDIAETARNNGRVLRALDSASRAVEGLTRRRFYPEADTRYFPWPQRHLLRPWRLWLDADEVISVDTLTAGGVTIPDTDYFLEPANDGPPFSHIEIDLASDSAFANVDTHQRAIAITGLFGYTAEVEPAGQLVGSLDGSTATVDVSDSAAAGVGTILLVEDEYMIVTGKGMLDTGVNTTGGLDKDNSHTLLPVQSGAAFSVDEVILVDAERMLVVDVAGNNLVVRRAFDGSVLDEHNSGRDVYALRRLTVDRGALGSSAAAHDAATAVRRHVVPGLVRELCIAEALNTIQQEQSGYARTFGAGESERLVGGRGLADIRAEAKRRYGRRIQPKAG